MFDYANLTREQLDAAYNLRARHPDFQQFLDRFAAESARARSTLRCTLDVPYGPAAGETLDVFPAADAGAPVLVFIHGGYWQNLDKSDHSFPALGLGPAGCAVVSVNYDLAPSVHLDEIVRQARRAVGWVCEHAADIGADPQRIYVAGHSAGGHLAAMIPSDPALQPMLAPRGGIRGICPISGLFDLEPIRRCYHNDVLKLDRDAAHRNSPLHQIPRTAAGMLLAVGDAESEPFTEGAAEYLAAWRNAGNPGSLLLIPDVNHFEIVAQLGEVDSALTQALLRFMKA